MTDPDAQAVKPDPVLQKDLEAALPWLREQMARGKPWDPDADGVPNKAGIDLNNDGVKDVDAQVRVIKPGVGMALFPIPAQLSDVEADQVYKLTMPPSPLWKWLRRIMHGGIWSGSFGLGLLIGSLVLGTAAAIINTGPPAAQVEAWRDAAKLHRVYLEDEASFDALTPAMRRASHQAATQAGEEVEPVEPIQ